MGKVYLSVIMLFMSFILSSSCSTVVNKIDSKLEKKRVFVILPFENNTETPLAGIRVSSMVEGVAISKGYNVKSDLYFKESKDYTSTEIDNLLRELREKEVDYVITGSVNEFRYKTGIDGEPAVSIVIKVIDIKSSKTVLVGTGSKTGWSHESITTVAQKAINRLLP